MTDDERYRMHCHHYYCHHCDFLLHTEKKRSSDGVCGVKYVPAPGSGWMFRCPYCERDLTYMESGYHRLANPKPEFRGTALP